MIAKWMQVSVLLVGGIAMMLTPTQVWDFVAGVVFVAFGLAFGALLKAHAND
jgi:putative Ca2+/H+ antiporter (TMEM165/GDT1 family)